MKKPLFPILITFLLLIICITLNAQSGYRIMLKTDFDGKVIEGSKKELIEAIREGNPVRVGWQLDFDDDKKPDFDHWMDAEFITILGEDVFTQIKNINAQIPNIEVPQVDIISDNLMWTGVLGTNSKLINRFVYEDIKYELDSNGKRMMNEKIEEEIKLRKPETWKVATFWAVSK